METSSVTIWGPHKPENDSSDKFWGPLLMSCVAGFSTSLGAAVVFCQPKRKVDNRDVPLVSDAQLSFSLSLAASVMITVSVVSIGPECLSVDNNNLITPDGLTSSWVPIWSRLFLHRLSAFLLGCFLYFLLSCFAFPDADEILGLDTSDRSNPSSSMTVATTVTASSRTSSRSNSPTPSSEDEGWSEQGTLENDNNGGHPPHDEESLSLLEADHHHATAPSESAIRFKKVRRGKARQRRRSLKMVSSITDDDGNTTADCDDVESVTTTTNYEKSDNIASTNSSLKVPSRRLLTKMMPCCHSTTGGSLLLLTENSSSSLSVPLTVEQRRAWRVALLLFVSLLCHNFPEGLAVAASALESPKLGLTVTIGIMIHNIPEGIAIAVPCLAAKPLQPWLAFWLASLSGLAEPVGALISLCVLRPLTSASAAAAAAAKAAAVDATPSSSSNIFLPRDEWMVVVFTMENILSFVAGIMITVAFMDLFPEAWRHSQQEKMYFITGTLTGILVMVSTELYLP